MTTTRPQVPQMSPTGAVAMPGTAGARGPDAGPAMDAQRPSVTIASYEDYGQAQQAVDYLSDRGFPVENAAIVGTGLHLVEQVTGRMTVGKAFVSGMGGGAWFGLLIGLLLGIFAVDAWLPVVITAVIIGALWGAVFGAIAHAMTRGQRDFSSRRRLEADEYAVNVTPSLADHAREMLAAGLPGR